MIIEKFHYKSHATRI